MFKIADLSKIVAEYELPEIETADDSIFGSLRFTIQILRLPNSFYAPRVLRKDYIQVTPAYSEKHDGLLDVATVEILVADTSFDWESLESDSEKQTLERTLEALKKLLNL